MTRREVTHEEGQGQGRRQEGLLIRPARSDEMPELAKQWRRNLESETRPVETFGSFVQVGTRRGSGLRRGVLNAALDAAFLFVLDDAVVDVCEQDGVSIGWVAWTAPAHDHPISIHFVFVDGSARRRGFGRYLMSYVLGFRDSRAPHFSCITASGAALYRAVAALTGQTAVAHAREAGSRVVETRGL